MALGIPAEVIDMKDYDPDDQLADEVRRVQRDDAFFPCLVKDRRVDRKSSV